MHLRILAFSLLIFGPIGFANARELFSFTFSEDTIDIKESKHDMSMLILPIVTFSPETSLRFGVTSIGLFRHKKADPSTHLSSFRTPLSYTINGQIKIRGSFDIFSNYNDHVFRGYAEWFKFPLLFYGIGNDTSDEDEEIYTTQSYGAAFSYLKRVKGKFYAGGNVEMLNSDIIEVEEDGQLAQDGLIPGNEGGMTVGMGILARLDSRNNAYNCSYGFYLQAGFTFVEENLGSDFDFNRLNLDFRYYQSVVQGRHILAFQVVTEHIWGDPSFETMVLLGGDEIMRGHFKGRFRDKSLWAMQTEYRLPIGRSHWIDNREKVPLKERFGLVAFLGVGAVAPSTSDFRIDNTKKSIGLGIRFLALPKERINVRVDFGFGTSTPGIYFNIREAF